MVPQSIEIKVPEEHGTVYEGQWVRRVIRVSREHYKAMRDIQDGKTLWLRDDKALSALSKVLAKIWTDWNLEGDEGPLPKPWENPKAFEVLATSDMNLCIWLVGKSLASVAELAEPSKN